MFDPGVLANDPTARAPVLQVLEAAVRAADPRRVVAAAVEDAAGGFRIGDHEIPCPAGRIRLLGLGKAAAGMAEGFVAALPHLEVTGVIATPGADRVPAGLRVVRGAHPVPDHGSLEAGRALLEAAASADPGDPVVVLVSGGGSACAEVPAPGLTIDDLAAATRVLLASGAPIEEVNTVRRALSSLKGGGLARAAATAPIVTLVLSDVLGNHLPAIAGGPTVPDPNRPGDAPAVVERYGLHAVLPGAVLDRIGKTPASEGPEPGPMVIVGDAATAARGASQAAAALGIAARSADAPLTGEARRAGTRLAEEGMDEGGPGMIVHAGETTVSVTGGGSGGRNQELALAAGIALDGTSGILVAAAGTDGVDGPTSAAGGIGDGATVTRGIRAGLDARAALAGNDSGTYLDATGDRLVCGPTGTNVGDVAIVYRPG